jgi:hypothetical protein
MGDHLGNLIFVVVAILAWIVKAAIEQREARNKSQARPASTQGTAQPPRADAGTGEVDVIYGRRKLPDAWTAPPPGMSATPDVAVRPPSAAATVGGPLDFGALPERSLGTHIAVSTAALPTAQGRRRTPTQAWARLGVSGAAPGRRAIRAGVLWSEILASPRAVTGPHRSPSQRRRDARRRG